MNTKRAKKIIQKIVLVLLIFLTVAGVGLWGFLYMCTSDNKAANKSDTKHEGLYVDGTSLRDSNGNEIVLRGINHAHCWFKDYDEIAFDAIKDTGSNCIRIVLADGERWNKDSAEDLKTIIEACRERNMIAVVEVHDGTGSNDIKVLENITDYWVEMAEVLKGTEEYCILNIANEWCGKWNSKIWKQGYIEAIPKLRAAGLKNVIMVDTAGWGQYARSIRKYGYDVFMSDPDFNTMFSVHMYGASGRYEWLIRYNLEGATKQNLCVCVGEFGYKHSDGNVKEEYLMKYCSDNHIGYMAWSFKGNGEGVEYLDLSLDWEGKQLSPEWGEKLVNGEYGIRNTSIIPNIFN